jgi:phage shock protein PspC (stress-responsive transcriptional regulator)
MDQQRPQDVQPEWQPLEQPAETPLLPPPGPKRLYRSSDQKMFLGVCGGLGEYFDIDPTTIRIIFAVSTLLAGTSIAVYAVLALIMPSEASLDADPRTAAQNTINEASDEVRKGVDMVVTRFNDMTGRGKSTASQTPPPPSNQPPPTPPTPPHSHDATTTHLPPSS